MFFYKHSFAELVPIKPNSLFRLEKNEVLVNLQTQTGFN